MSLFPGPRLSWRKGFWINKITVWISTQELQSRIWSHNAHLRLEKVFYPILDPEHLCYHWNCIRSKERNNEAKKFISKNSNDGRTDAVSNRLISYHLTTPAIARDNEGILRTALEVKDFADYL